MISRNVEYSPEELYKKFFSEIIKLENKIDWVNDSIIKQGTGKKIMNSMRDKIISIIDNQ